MIFFLIIKFSTNVIPYITSVLLNYLAINSPKTQVFQGTVGTLLFCII